jgi:hypothetical protein
MSLPFVLPERPPVTRIRRSDAGKLGAPTGPRTQPMKGFEDQYVDIVDYIVRITDEIWMDRAIGRIYDTYDASCTIYSSYGRGAIGRGGYRRDDHHLERLSRRRDSSPQCGVERRRRGGLLYLPSWPQPVHQRRPHEFRSGNRQARLDTALRQTASAWRIASTPNGSFETMARWFANSASTCMTRHVHLPRQRHRTIHRFAPRRRLEGQKPRKALDVPSDTLDGWVRHMFHNLWNLKRLDWLDHIIRGTS